MGTKIGLDCGPIGKMLEPNGDLTIEDAYAYFKEVLIAGERAGVDFVIFETMTDLLELKTAILAAKENTALPIFATMSFEANGRTFAGQRDRKSVVGKECRSRWSPYH